MSQSSFSDSQSGCSTNSPSTSNQINLSAMSDHRAGEPHLEITEQPDKYHFRSEKEMKGKHGSILGIHSSRTDKTYPTVHLHNFTGEAVVRCSLYQVNSPMLHPHMLIRCANKELTDPNEVKVILPVEGSYTATFEGMGIVSKNMGQLKDELIKKLIEDKKFKLNSETLTPDEREAINQIANNALIDKHQVRLCFDAYQSIEGKWTPICQPVYSMPIRNKNTVQHNDLKIVEHSSNAGSASGGDNLILLVSQVGRDDIQVRFFKRETSWKVDLKPDYVHYQYAIKLKTPPYRDPDTKKDVKVLIELHRPSDGAVSDPIEYCYKPSNDCECKRKRPRTEPIDDIESVSFTEELPSEVLRAYQQDFDPNVSASELGRLVTDGVGLFDKRPSYLNINYSLKECFDDNDKVQSQCLNLFQKMSLRSEPSTSVDNLMEQTENHSNNQLITDLTHQLSPFNKNQKWKRLAIALQYGGYIHLWEKLRNPIRALLLFAKAQKMADDDIVDAIKELGEN